MSRPWTDNRLAEELNPERENKKKKTNKPPGIRFRWRQRDERGQIVSQTRKATTSTSVAPRASTSRARLVQHFGPVTKEEESETRTSGLESTPVLNIDEEIGRYNVTVPVLTCTTCLSTWTANLADLIKNGYWPATVNRDTIYQVDLIKNGYWPATVNCDTIYQVDLIKNGYWPASVNRDTIYQVDLIKNGYWPATVIRDTIYQVDLIKNGYWPATVIRDTIYQVDLIKNGYWPASVNRDTIYQVDLIKNGYWPATVIRDTIYQVDLIKNGYWPASVNRDTIYQVDLIKNGYWSATVNRDTIYQNGMICGDTFQKSFFEWTYCRSEIDQACDLFPRHVSVDGNKKLYRFKNRYVKLFVIDKITPYPISFKQSKQGCCAYWFS
ncbi:uncharacterized protein ACWYII_030488 [Salvelinus alpinus]